MAFSSAGRSGPLAAPPGHMDLGDAHGALAAGHGDPVLVGDEDSAGRAVEATGDSGAEEADFSVAEPRPGAGFGVVRAHQPLDHGGRLAPIHLGAGAVDLLRVDLDRRTSAQ